MFNFSSFFKKAKEEKKTRDKFFDEFPYKIRPWEHQINAMAKANLSKGFAYFMEQGTGKTKTVLDESQILNHKRMITRVVIACPKSLLMTWKNEIEMHCNNYKTEVWKDKKIYGEGNLIYSVINIDAIKTEKGFKWLQDRVHSKTLFIVDESQAIKNIKAKRTGAILMLARKAGYKRILTGTPMTKNPLDLFSQMIFLDRQFWNNKGFYSFRNKFARLGGYGGKQVVGFKNLAMLSNMVDPHSFRVTKDECLDLPPKLYSTRYLYLTSKQQSQYNELGKQLGEYWISEKTKVAYNNTMVIIGKMHQLVGGNLDDMQYDCNKIEECVNILSEGSGKTLIWCKYIKEIERLKMTLEDNGYKVGTYHGSVSAKKREENKEEFNHGDMDVLILQYSCGGVGLTLNSASTVIFYSNGYVYADRIQAEDRCHRGGQTKSVHYIDLVSLHTDGNSTIDSTILNTLQNKKSLAEEVMNNLGDSSWMNF